MKRMQTLAAQMVIPGIAIVALMTFAACNRRETAAIPADLAARFVVLAPDAGTPPTGSWHDWLNRYMPTSPRYAQTMIEAAIGQCLLDDRTLIVTTAPPLDDAHTARLQDFTSRGGRILFLGLTQPPIYDLAMEGSTFALTTSALRVTPPTAIDLPPLAVNSPGFTQRGYGGQRAPAARWIPVVETIGPRANITGWAGSVWLRPQPPEAVSITGWMGFETTEAIADRITAPVLHMLREISREIYLYQYGLERHAAPAQTPLQITAKIIDRRQDPAPLRLVAEWINQQGQEVRRHVSPPISRAYLPAQLSIGLAPEPASGRPEPYTIRLLVRDRNDQNTLDQAGQSIKLFPRTLPPPNVEPVTVQAGQLAQGRRPIFMLGVNYWPRLIAQPSHDHNTGHWLDPERFDPAIVTSDLDILAAAGINAIALEYIDLVQAPQLLYVLDELRRRSMWATLYLPSLHPLDLRMDDALRMLQEIDIAAWPEVFALEAARGLAIRSRPERRRLDQDWAQWMDEHFNAPQEAEQKLGISLWKERGRLTGPPDAQLRRGPHRDDAVGLYYLFLSDYVSRNLGYVRRTLRARGINALLTLRSAYGWPDTPPRGVIDNLGLLAGSIHQDILSPDAWTIHPLRAVNPDGELMTAYARGIGRGKPILWAAYGQYAGREPNPQSLQRQQEVYQHYLNLFTRTGASGAFAWWYPAGTATPDSQDWGLVTPQGAWRPVEDVFRATRLQLRQSRTQPGPALRHPGQLIQSALQWREEQGRSLGLFALNRQFPDVTEWTLPGANLKTETLLNPQQTRPWTEVEGMYLLNAEWGEIRSGDTRQERPPYESARLYLGQPLRAELINSGTVQWSSTPDRRAGSVWIRISQPGHPDDWVAASAAERDGRQTIRWQPRDPGLWEIQPYIIGYGKFGERLRVEVTTPPQLF